MDTSQYDLICKIASDVSIIKYFIVLIAVILLAWTLYFVQKVIVGVVKTIISFFIN
jgi:hypothetical protein